MKSDKYYWDYISSLTPSESKETIKGLCQENFHFLRPVLDELFWVDSHVVFLNLVCGVPQMKIASIMGTSQLGISKRVRSAWKKIRVILMRPESDVFKIRSHFHCILSGSLVETALIYYQIKTFSVTSRILGGVKEGAVRVRIHQVLEDLKKVKGCGNIREMVEAIREIKPLEEEFVLKRLSDMGEPYFEFLRDTAERYLGYFELVLPVGYYSDFIYKKFDKDRLSQR